MNNNYEEEGFVSIWIGKLTGDELNAYLQEDYSADGDSIPSAFANDIGVVWYDSDFQDAIATERNENMRSLVERLSYSSTFYPPLMGSLVEEGTAIIALYDYRFSGQMPPNAKVQFVGVFNYKKND